MSVIALLALACFPVLAHAETSSGVQYDDSLPSAEGGNTPTHHQQTPAKASNTGNGGGTAPSQSGPEDSTKADGSGEGDSSSKEGAVPASQDGGKGQGSPGGSANGEAKNGLHPDGQTASGTPTSQTSDDDGSSPLVPILLAIAVLAAVSVAAVMYRQRRQRRGPGATASPEAS
jgi:cobalamin biosynthesis Mg chelatase CobN